MGLLGEKFTREFGEYLIEEKHDWGHQYIFRFSNGYGASVIKSIGTYGYYQDLWEMGLIFFDENGDWVLTYEKDFATDVLGYLTDENVSELLRKIMEY